jgi:sugar-phosphatase
VAQLALVCHAVLFDLDGVLVDSEAVVVRAWHRWAARQNLDVPDLVRRAHGRRSLETVRDVAPELDAEAEAQWLEAAELADADGLRIVPGAATLFDSLSNRQRAVVTSGGRALAQFRLTQVGLPTPTVFVTAEDVQTGKPSPDGYLLAAGRLGLDASACVVIEDTPAGIAAGKAAGATVLAVSSTFPPSALLDADVVVRSLTLVDVATAEAQVRLSIREEGQH